MSDDQASEQAWIESARGLDDELQDFEAYIWPIFRERGYSKDTALLCWYINLTALNVANINARDDDEEDED